jgi:hypothetical protein
MTHTVATSPRGKILLEALAALLQLPPATIVDKALNAYRAQLTSEDQAALDAFCGRVIHNREALRAKAPQQSGKTEQPVVTYEATRVTFKRDEIERLKSDDEFRMVTPVGVFQMSKADFYGEFPNVVASKSYKNGVYSYPQVPFKAEGFRVHA